MVPDSKRKFSILKTMLFSVVSVTIALLMLEVVCAGIATWRGRYKTRPEYPYNRTLSGYSVFRNTPYYKGRNGDGYFVHPDGEMKGLRVFVLGGSTAAGAKPAPPWSACTAN